MHDTPQCKSSASPQLRAVWRGMSAAERDRWTFFQAHHPACCSWAPLRVAIIECGFRLPPTEAEAALLWPIVDARPISAAAWFR